MMRIVQVVKRGAIAMVIAPGVARAQNVGWVDGVSSSIDCEFPDIESAEDDADNSGHPDAQIFALAAFIQVNSGGEFVAKQNTFGNEDYPVKYLSGSIGEFRRNAAFDAGAGLAVEVTGGASVASGQNMGDWTTNALNGANGTDPAWVITARGDFHLSATSPLIDICTIDGDWDIEGAMRPADLQWDGGAIEFDVP
jgi:hypothetical protein